MAVGDHILLGGDNMDLALAQAVARELGEENVRLDTGQMLMLWHACRAAKEQLSANSKLAGTPVTVLGRGSKVVGGALKSELTREELERVLVEGFFPHCPLDAEPGKQRTAEIARQRINVVEMRQRGVAKTPRRVGLDTIWMCHRAFGHPQYR